MTVALDEFCQRMECDPREARDLLAAAGNLSGELAMPWYVRTMIGLGAWITALVAITLGVAVLEVGLSIEPMAGAPLTILGSLSFALSLVSLRGLAPDKLFFRQTAIAVAAAGVGLTSAGVGLLTKELWVASLTGWILLGLVIELSDSDALQFLSALLAVTLTHITLTAEAIPYALDIVSAAVPLGLWLLLRPPRINLRPTAVVLLLGLPLLGPQVSSMLDALSQAEPGGWIARLVCIVSGLAVILQLWRRAATVVVRQHLAAVAIATVVVGLLLPPGGSATLVILLLAYTLGSRALAIVGCLLFIRFLWEFYYDLQLSLLDKSLILMAAGLVLIALWWTLARRLTEQASR